MTILCFDGRMMAADTLTSSADTTVYNRSKIRILKQMAIATTGLEEDGERFVTWMAQQDRGEFIANDSFAALVLTRTLAQCYGVDEVGDPVKPSTLHTKWGVGASAATSYSEALMREVKFNAHKACERAAGYDRNCGMPVYSITKKQLECIHQDFDGYWIGTYQTSLKDTDDYLITHKQWLRT